MDINETIAEKINELRSERNAIRDKLVELGLAQSDAMLDSLAEAISGIVNQGAVQIQVKFGQTVAIPAGMHNGGGTVSGVAGDGDFGLQQKKITPTKQQQVVNEDEGYYGLSSVIIEAIPVNYQDVSEVTAAPEDVRAGKIIVLANGSVKAGAMPENGKVTVVLDTTTKSYNVPAGHHDGTGTVSVIPEFKIATPTKTGELISPTPGKVLSGVSVTPIPQEYQDVSGVTATAADVRPGVYFVDESGEVIEGEMPTRHVYRELTPGRLSYTVPEGYHDGSGEVYTSCETARVTPTKETQMVYPAESRFLEFVTVRPIPDNFVDSSDATASASSIFIGKTAYVNGVKIEGTMANNGALSGNIDGIYTVGFSIPKGFTSGGFVQFDPAKIIEMLDSI